MTNNEDNKNQFKSDKWLYYQDVKVLKVKIKPTEQEKKVEDFRDFINKKEKDTKKNN